MECGDRRRCLEIVVLKLQVQRSARHTELSTPGAWRRVAGGKRRRRATTGNCATTICTPEGPRRGAVRAPPGSEMMAA